MPGSCGRSSSPQLTGYARERRTGGALLGTVPVLDEARAAHLARARESVRAYTAAAHSGRASDARQLLDVFPVPARALSAGGAAAAWGESSATARDAVRVLAAQRAAATAEVSAGPELLHAATCYVAAREGQLHLVRDVLGRLAFPVPVSRGLPVVLAPVAAVRTHCRVIEASALWSAPAETLEGQIRYQLRQLVPVHRRATTGAERDLLSRALGALERVRAVGVLFHEEDVRARLQGGHDPSRRPGSRRPGAAHQPRRRPHPGSGFRARFRDGPRTWILSTVRRPWGVPFG
ncbi:hypothetical protein [Streptomyces nigra]|uniref:hypothetical protein n=1 Tax=Streptomyces nigra TaxID=1827580 RepID=UPI00341A0B13